MITGTMRGIWAGYAWPGAEESIRLVEIDFATTVAYQYR